MENIVPVDFLADLESKENLADRGVIEVAKVHRYGSYKLSKFNILKLMPKRVKALQHFDANDYEGHEVELANLSSAEIILLVGLTRISSASGYIDELCVQEIMDRFGFKCKKTVYNAINGLDVKGYVEVDYRTYGFPNMQINDNSFETEQDDAKGYLNTNRNCFIRGTKEYDAFCGLSLYAKKVFLYLLLNYNPTDGYRVNLNTIAKLMGLSNKALVQHYIREIESVLGKDFCTIVSSKQQYKRAEKVAMFKARTTSLFTNDSIFRDQITFEKRTLQRFISKCSLEYQFIPGTPTEEQDEHTYLNALFAFYVKYADIPYETVKNVIQDTLLAAGKVGPAELKKIDIGLKEIPSNVSLAI